MRFLPLLLALAIVGCATDAPDDATTDAETTTEDASSAEDTATDAFVGVSDAFVRAAPAGGVSAIFMTITNTTASGATLVAVRTDASNQVEIHRTQEGEAGMSERVELDNGLAGPAGDSVTLEPGGLHVMLLDLQRELVEGDSIEVEYEFASGGMFSNRVAIQGIGE